MIIARRFSWWDRTLGLLLRFSWELISKKRSHFWNWHKGFTAYQRGFAGKNLCVVSGSPEARSWQTWLGALYQLNFGWQTVVVLEPDNPMWPSVTYRIGYVIRRDASGVQFDQCDLVLRGPTAVLVGPDEATFFARTCPGNRLVPLKVVCKTTKANLGRIHLI
ncbi:MAG: hypothetical protein HY978_02720 [Candidatus Liptonbacteria bacterium]|nr:hypothetical protein [Candidatus Liptonbacteria bacterium]